MRAMIIDAYRANNQVVLWLQSDEQNIRYPIEYKHVFYVQKNNLAANILYELGIDTAIVTKKTYDGKQIQVYQIVVPHLKYYEQLVRTIEYAAKHRLLMFNADIAPEQMYLYQHHLHPFMIVDIENRIIPTSLDAQPQLDLLTLDINTYQDMRAHPNSPIKRIMFDNQIFGGEEKELLRQFVDRFHARDPDVIVMERAFFKLAYLEQRLQHHQLQCKFHRWDPLPIKQKGGKTFFSYGKVMYREFAIRLNGRFLVDSSSTLGEECNVGAIAELAKLSSTRFQHIASRSFGAVFQSSLIATIVRKNRLVPFKEKPVDQPITLFEQMKFDRVGHTFDAKMGLHHDVAEIDFSSLFPWIIFNYNISTETLNSKEKPLMKLPGLDLTISLARKGIVPTAIKPLLDRRMHYKKHPTPLNKERAVGLKWVLVTSYGYLRFREFKLGVASSHMAIGAFAREILMRAKEICEAHGFSIVHGIVDSLYIKKKNVSKQDVIDVCNEIELETGLSLSFEGLFKWIVFLPSVNDNHRPVPTRYYGVFDHGSMKIRGLEIRQAGVPKFVKQFQHDILGLMASCDTKEDIVAKFDYFCQLLRKYLFTLSKQSADQLSCMIRVSKTKYKHNIAQKQALDLMKKKGVSVIAGQRVYFVYGKKGIVLPQDYNGKPNVDQYKKLLIRALFVVLQPFGFTKQEIYARTGESRQSTLEEYRKNNFMHHLVIH